MFAAAKYFMYRVTGEADRALSLREQSSYVERLPASLPTSRSIRKPAALDFASQGRGDMKCEVGEPVTIVSQTGEESER